ncbi:hypothetical protein [Sphingobium cyanobacteriorum]|uniref:hypothetical protein n=1 Tax=Sphingobium cyanobacteriorum TaxID=3063954 RepID=UPI003014E59F
MPDDLAEVAAASPESARRAISATFAPAAETAATSSRFCWSVHTRRRSGPEISVI